MDIFQTSVTSCIIIYQFIDSYSHYSTRSRSLAARFKWDSHVLQSFVDFFTSRQVHGHLSDEDARLLDESVTYLSSLMERLSSARTRIADTNRWSKEVNRALWMFRKNEFEDLASELLEWTQRLDLRLVALPERLRNGIIPVEGTEQKDEEMAYTPAPVIQRRIEMFLGSSPDARKKEWESIWIDTPESRIILSEHSSARFMMADFDSRKVIVEYKPYPTHCLGDSAAFESFKQEVGDFAAALKSLDSNTPGLLKCIGFFHETESPPSFALVHELPIPIKAKPPSLKALISSTDASRRRLLPAHPLNERFELARKLAAAVFFLHSIKWVHKAIRSQNVLVIEKAHLENSPDKKFPHSLGDPHLVNFRLSRNNDGESDPNTRGVRGWEEEIFHHPKRQILEGEGLGARYSMQHDVYSLGVVLLELGIWRPLERYAEDLRDRNPLERRDFLTKLAQESEIYMGRRYKELVIWCLRLDGDDTSGDLRYAANVLEHLEDSVTALS